MAKTKTEAPGTLTPDELAGLDAGKRNAPDDDGQSAEWRRAWAAGHAEYLTHVEETRALLAR